jgi:hypothetical protein
MDEDDLFKKKKRDKDSDLFEEPDLDLDSDHPVHEEFVDNKRLREMKKKKLIRE